MVFHRDHSRSPRFRRSLQQLSAEAGLAKLIKTPFIPLVYNQWGQKCRNQNCFSLPLALRGVLLALSFAGASQAADLKKVTLQLDWLPTGYHGPIFLAQQKGYYRDAGIDLKIIDGQGTTAALQAVASGNADIVLANYARMIHSVSTGISLVAVGGLLQRLPDAIVSLQSAPITDPKQLEGTTIATSAADAASKLLPAFLQSAKVDAAKVTIVNTAFFRTGAGGACSVAVRRA